MAGRSRDLRPPSRPSSFDRPLGLRPSTALSAAIGGGTGGRHHSPPIASLIGLPPAPLAISNEAAIALRISTSMSPLCHLWARGAAEEKRESRSSWRYMPPHSYAPVASASLKRLTMARALMAILLKSVPSEDSPSQSPHRSQALREFVFAMQ